MLGAFGWWCGRHPMFVRRLRRVVQVAYLAAIPLVILAVLLLPKFGNALVPVVFMTLGLGVMTCLARTRTVGWRTVVMVFGIGVWWAFAVALLTAAVAGWAGLGVDDDGTRTSLAAFVEEPGKLALVLAICVVAPGRVRRFAATDWALVGFAVGAGFTVAEDGVRRLQDPGLLGSLLQALWGIEDVPYSLNPWLSGMLVDPQGTAIVVGHQVGTATVAMAVGLGIVLWRSQTVPAHRVWAWLLPGAALALVISDHAAFNASVGLSGWPDMGGEGFPGWMWLVWTIGGQGRLAILLSMTLFLTCLWWMRIGGQRLVGMGFRWRMHLVCGSPS